MNTQARIVSRIIYIKSIIFYILIFCLKVNADTKIIAKDRDTLFTLSKQYSVELKELMYKNNINDANKNLGGKPIIIPLKNISNNNTNTLSYKVKEGDTLYKISREYNVNFMDIISINNLENASYLKTNQVILLPKGALKKKEINQRDIKLASKAVFYHTISEGETLSDIALIHNISIERIIDLNNLNTPIKVTPSKKLKIRDNPSTKWLSYGPLMINWSSWSYFDSNYVTKAKNKKNKAFYLAISCDRRTLNNTLNNSSWPNWYFPEDDFEFQIINDFCEKDFMF